MHEHGSGLGLGHQFGVDLVGGQGLDALGPDFHRLAHADPHIGVDDIRTGHSVGVLGQGDGGAAALGKLFALFHQGGVRPVSLGGAGHEIQAHLGAADHQAVAHVVAGVAHVGKLEALQLAEMLPQGEEVGQDLGGVVLVGQAVPDGHAGIPGQLLHDGLAVAAVLDALKHAGKHLGGVGDGLLFADLAAGGVQVGGAHAQIVGGDLKAAAGAGGSFLKNERHVFAAQRIVGDAGLLFGFQLSSQVQQAADLGRGKVQQR